MKKQLYLLALLVCTATYSKQGTIAEKALEFNRMEKKHKDDWFNFMKDSESEKIGLVKKNHDECADLKARHIQNEIDNPGMSKESMMKKCLDEVVALHEKQGKEWEAMAKAHYGKKQAICEKHKKELASFKAGLEGGM